VSDYLYEIFLAVITGLFTLGVALVGGRNKRIEREAEIRREATKSAEQKVLDFVDNLQEEVEGMRRSRMADGREIQGLSVQVHEVELQLHQMSLGVITLLAQLAEAGIEPAWTPEPPPG